MAGSSATITPTTWRSGSAGSLPEEGDGSLNALAELVAGFDGSVRSAGARFFHFVNGGTTPAALGADWFATALDQNAGAWVSTPLGAQLERVALGWLKELFGLPASMGGVLTTGATMANFTALACARRWAALEQDVIRRRTAWPFLPPIPVFASGYLHPSDVKALVDAGDGSPDDPPRSPGTGRGGWTWGRSRRRSARGAADRRSSWAARER